MNATRDTLFAFIRAQRRISSARAHAHLEKSFRSRGTAATLVAEAVN